MENAFTEYYSVFGQKVSITSNKTYFDDPIASLKALQENYGIILTAFGDHTREGILNGIEFVLTDPNLHTRKIEGKDNETIFHFDKDNFTIYDVKFSDTTEEDDGTITNKPDIDYPKENALVCYWMIEFEEAEIIIYITSHWTFFADIKEIKQKFFYFD
jgi:hypothetical protein